jgi:2-oxoglutarate dehydrogenase E2 component (dihydrolipoamide succinyltransferase)
MSIELKIPEVGESITEVEIGSWLKQEGQEVKKDEPLVTLESEKATVELPAPESGVVTRVLKKQGEVAKVGEVIAYLETDGHAATAKPTQAKEKKSAPEPAQPSTPPPPPKTKPDSEPQRKEAEPKIVTPTQRAPAEKPAEPETLHATDNADGREEEVVPMSRLRRTIAERLVEARKQRAGRTRSPQC